MKVLPIAATWLCLAGLASLAGAHPLAPALLELRETAQGAVQVRWKTAPFGVPDSPTLPRLPASCVTSDAPRETTEGGAIVSRWTVDCGPAGLVGQTIAVDGLGAAQTDALLRVVLEGGHTVQAVLRPSASSFVVPSRPSALGVVRDYAWLGVEHILTGPDHLAFVLGLVLLVGTGGTLVKTITAFTLGHSVTLTLVVLDLLRVPSRLAELAIAITVLALATEIGRPAPAPSPMRRWPWLVAAAFGLLHGLGFAGALREVGLPAGDVPLALVGFNVGIEIGQLAFVAAILAGASVLHRLLPGLPAWAARVPAYGIGSLAALWCFERAVPFFQ